MIQFYFRHIEDFFVRIGDWLLVLTVLSVPLYAALKIAMLFGDAALRRLRASSLTRAGHPAWRGDGLSRPDMIFAFRPAQNIPNPIRCSMNQTMLGNLFRDGAWVNLPAARSFKYTCGYCGLVVSSVRGYGCASGSTDVGAIYICSHCNAPSVVHGVDYFPQPKPGERMEHLPADVEDVYEEARTCAGAGAYAAAAMMLCRLLMTVAVANGAAPDQRFAFYIGYLEQNQYVSLDDKPWARHILENADEASHLVPAASREDVEALLGLSVLLMKTVYELPEDARRKTAKIAAVPNPSMP